MNIERWIIRFAAFCCACGSACLFWVFGVFVAAPWRTGRMLAINASEIQLLGASLVFGSLAAWTALHLFALGEKETCPPCYRFLRALLIAALFITIVSGVLWHR